MISVAEHVTASAAPRAARATRAPIAYLVSRFPRLTETFILREILELERRGLAVEIFRLLSVEQPVRHPEVERVLPQVHDAPFLSRAVLAANWRFLRRSPSVYLKTWGAALAGTCRSPNLFVRTVALFPKAVYFSRRMEQAGIRHIHAHFATHPALAAFVAGELTGISFSLTAHAHDIFVHSAMLRAKLRKARFVVTISEYNRQYLLRLCPDLPEGKVHVVRCGVESAGFERLAAGGQRAERRTRSAPTILCVASLEPYKGIRHLVKACALLRREFPELRCLVVGDGKLKRQLEQLIGRLALAENVRLLGPRPQHEVTKLLAEADFFVAPSVVARNGQMDGIPVALMEAMAAELPVVASRLSGIPELVVHESNGLLVAPGDEQGLAEAIARLSRQPELRCEFGGRAREMISVRYDLATNVAKLHRLFEQALAETPRAPLAGLDQELLLGIREAVERLHPGPTEHGSGLDIRPLRTGSGCDSVVYKVLLNDPAGRTRELILKLHRPGRANSGDRVAAGRECARREYEALSLLWPVLERESPRLRVPRPCQHFPEAGAVLLEKCAGEPFERRLRWAVLRGAGTSLLRGAAACGEWLAAFHRVSQTVADPTELRERIERSFTEELAGCVKAKLDPGLARDVAKDFFRRWGRLAPRPTDAVGCHGDFGPHNVFLDTSKVTAIDFEGFRPGFRYEDLADFLSLIEMMPAYHLDSRQRRDVGAAFLEAYARRHSVEPEALETFCIAALVKRAAHNPRLAAGGSWPEHWRRMRLLRSYENRLREGIR